MKALANGIFFTKNRNFVVGWLQNALFFPLHFFPIKSNWFWEMEKCFEFHLKLHDCTVSHLNLKKKKWKVFHSVTYHFFYPKNGFFKMMIMVPLKSRPKFQIINATNKTEIYLVFLCIYSYVYVCLCLFFLLFL